MRIEEYNLLYENNRESFDALHQHYNPDGSPLREYQLHLTTVLSHFDALCRKHDIKYYIAYGTLLGAVRHHGFIPWDDDADLWIEYGEYKKLLSIMSGQYNELIKDKLYVSMGIRPELWAPPFAYIDIFVLYPSPNNVLLRFLKERRLQLLYCLVKAKEKMGKSFNKKTLFYLPFMPIALWGSLNFWRKRRQSVLTWLTEEKFTRCCKYYQSYDNTLMEILTKYPAEKQFWETVRLPFEDTVLNAPAGFEELLTIRYGLFMNVPDAAHIHQHDIVENQFVPAKSQNNESGE